MYDTAVSDYKITRTPFGRDPLKELQWALEKRGLKLGIYYSQMQDWEDPDTFGNSWDFDPKKKGFAAYYERKVRPQVKELLENYGKVWVMWFDTPYHMPQELCRDLRDLVKSIQPHCLVNSRAGHGLGDYLVTGDNCMPARPWETPWELPITLEESWGYHKDEHDFRSPKELLHALSSCVSLGATCF